MTLLDIAFAKEKVRAALAQIAHLKSTEFPYDEPRSALTTLEKLFETDLGRLEQLDTGSDADLRQQTCAHSNMNVAIYHEVLGLILRSTNIRNAFEIYDPLLNISKQACGPATKLILSSEWSFSPLTYTAVFKELPDLIFIGLPATEAGNSLVVPLAGHELGHSVWRSTTNKVKIALETKLQAQIIAHFEANWSEFKQTYSINAPPERLIQDLFLQSILARSIKLGVRQIEELFCDLFGLYLFREGFLYAFAYILSPNLGERVLYYPKLAVRIGALKAGCGRFGTTWPANFKSFFQEPSRRLGKKEEFVVRMADAASESLVKDVLDSVGNYSSAQNLPMASDSERDRIAHQFRSLSPASSAKTLADIINAGWAMRLDTSAWASYSFSDEAARRVLNNLVFKTVEVMEFERRVGNNA